jgi:hypothetical protein
MVFCGVIPCSLVPTFRKNLLLHTQSLPEGKVSILGGHCIRHSRFLGWGETESTWYVGH